MLDPSNQTKNGKSLKKKKKEKNGLENISNFECTGFCKCMGFSMNTV